MFLCEGLEKTVKNMKKHKWILKIVWKVFVSRQTISQKTLRQDSIFSYMFFADIMRNQSDHIWALLFASSSFSCLYLQLSCRRSRCMQFLENKFVWYLYCYNLKESCLNQTLTLYTVLSWNSVGFKVLETLVFKNSDFDFQQAEC